jgi:transposase
LRWQFQSLARRLDSIELERTRAKRTVAKLARKLPIIEALKSIPGVKSVGAPTLVAWIVDPGRFNSRNARSSYSGLGLARKTTNWKPVGRARASKRPQVRTTSGADRPGGNRQLKRVLFIAATAAISGDNAFARRYQARIASGWEHRKAIRDVARKILFTACAIMRTGREYDDGRVSVPKSPGDAGRLRD